MQIPVLKSDCEYIVKSECAKKRRMRYYTYESARHAKCGIPHGFSMSVVYCEMCGGFHLCHTSNTRTINYMKVYDTKENKIIG